MFRLLIADDEDEERRGIRFLLDKYGFSFEVMEAVDGAQALELLGQFKPDVLLTDVKMPFMNGLELAVETRRRSPQTQLIFFSGYDDFEYVRQALSLQAVDYILKPVNPQEFARTFGLVIERLKEEKARRESRSIAERRQDILTRNYMLARLLNQVPYEKLLAQYGPEALAFCGAYTRLLLIEFEEDAFGRSIPDPQEFAAQLKEVTALDFDFLDLTPSQGIFLLRNAGCEDAGCRAAAQQIYLHVRQRTGQDCYLSVGRRLTSPQDIAASYREAENSLEERFFYPNLYIYPADGEREQGSAADGTDAKFLQAIGKDIACHDTYSLRRDMEALMALCRNNGFQSYIYTRFVCANLMRLLVQELPEGDVRLTGLVEQVYGCANFSELETILWQAEQETEGLLSQAEDTPKRAVAQVEQYIMEHYAEPLSLDVLADRVYLTPHYLSTIFAQEKGIGINKYIKNVRMEQARKLLRDTNMKISDICTQVGYANLSYFCRSFRNEYGVTPEQYRK